MAGSSTTSAGSPSYQGPAGLRIGYTTGTCAAAAAKAAVALLLTGRERQTVAITLPAGADVNLRLSTQSLVGKQAVVGVVKDAGSDPDVTHGMEILAAVEPDDDGLRIAGGEGIGVVTRAGLGVSVGQAAINPVPRKMISRAVAEAIAEHGDGQQTVGEPELSVTILAPDGKRRARRTLNSKLGIVDGVSIIGTTGFVRPMSAAAYKAALRPQLKMASAAGHRVCVLTPGNKGERVAEDYLGWPLSAVVQMSNFPAFALKMWVKVGGEGALLVGHLGKLAKIAQGSPNTHSKVSPLDFNFLAAVARGKVPPSILAEIRESASAEEAGIFLRKQGFGTVLNELASKVSAQARHWVRDELVVGTMLTDGGGGIVGSDDAAARITADAGASFPRRGS